MLPRAQIEGALEVVTAPCRDQRPLGAQCAIARSAQTRSLPDAALLAPMVPTAAEQDPPTHCATPIKHPTGDRIAPRQGVETRIAKPASAPPKGALRLSAARWGNDPARLRAVRRSVQGIGLRNLSFDGANGSAKVLAVQPRPPGKTGVTCAEKDDPFERLGVFVNGYTGWGGKDAGAEADGFDFTTTGFDAGADYRLAQGLVLGFALGYANTGVDVGADGGDLDVTTRTGTLRATYYATEHFYLEGAATYGRSDYRHSRTTGYALPAQTRQAKADYDGSQYALMLGAGRDLILGAGILDLYGRLRYLGADLDGGHGPPTADLRIGARQAGALHGILGVGYTRSFGTAKAVLLTQGWLEWTHELDSSEDGAIGPFAETPGVISLALATDRFDTDSVRLGLGLGAQFGRGRIAFVAYEATIGLDSFTEHTLSLGVRLDF